MLGVGELRLRKHVLQVFATVVQRLVVVYVCRGVQVVLELNVRRTVLANVVSV